MDQYGRSSLHHLCANYQGDDMLNVMELLMADVARGNCIENQLYWCQESDKFGMNALHLTCQNHSGPNLKDIVQFSIDKCRIDFRATTDKSGRNAVHFFCQNYFKGGGLKDIIQLFVDRGIDSSATEDSGNVLHLLCCANYK